jgi:hypothetical protein
MHPRCDRALSARAGCLSSITRGPRLCRGPFSFVKQRRTETAIGVDRRRLSIRADKVLDGRSALLLRLPWHTRRSIDENLSEIAISPASGCLLDQHVDLELAIFLGMLDRDEVKRMVGWDGFDPYQHPESLLEALSESDSEFLRAAQKEQRLGEFLGDFSDSFQAELTGAVIKRLK